MKVNGRELASQLLLELKQKVTALKNKPILAVIQVGDDPSSTVYINQKRKRGEEIGVSVIHKHFPSEISQEQLTAEIQTINTDNKIRGIIIQKPLPSHISTLDMINAVAAEKDIDGFRPDSPFIPPVALAVLHILSTIFPESQNTKYKILNTKKTVILGRGETAGKPIARTFEKMGIPFTVIHSTSQNAKEIIQAADIVISCVGKGRVVGQENLKKGVVLIGVGISRDEAGKLHGDYNEEEIEDIASYYTPTPGGVGPLTVAFLLSNLVHDTEPVFEAI